MFVFTLIVIGCLCLAFRPTRLTGVTGLTLLSLVYPLLFLALLVIGGAIFLFHLLHKEKSKCIHNSKTTFPTPLNLC